MKKILSFVLLSCVALVAVAQDRYLVDPRREAIPISRDESALRLAEKPVSVEKSFAVQSTCSSGGAVGLTTPGNVDFAFGNGDVCLQQLIAPVTGVIESVYFRGGSSGGSGSMRIFQGRPLSCGGFYRSGDSCGCTRAFKDIPGMDTTWVPRCPGGQDPNGPEIWGMGGYTIPWWGNPQGIAMMELGYEPVVTAGQPFNICLRVPCPPAGDRRDLLAENTSGAASFMKFYCRGRTVGDSTTVGWWFRSEYNMDIWAVIRATGNVPPTVASVSQVHDTLGSFPVVVQATIFDCNFSTPSDTGVASATLQYTTNAGSSFIDAVMTNFPGQGWLGTIPALPFSSIVGYRVRATDNHGLVSSPTSVKTYRLVEISRDGYITTNNAPYSFVDITGAGGGTQIPVSAFFNTTAPNDDGTAGPFDMGGVFTGLFGHSQRYAWIGVNGAICLSNSPTDTVRVGNGFSLYNVPTTAAPKNFIAPFWNDFIIGPGGNGSIWYKVSGSQFIVEWYHIGNFNAAEDTLTAFEMILDRGVLPLTMTFLYQNVGNTTLPMDGVIALQDDASDTSRYVYINRAGYPSATRVHDSYAIQLRLYIEHVGEEAPLQYSLSANYPNPFNPSTTIRYELPQTSHVMLRVFNVLGQEVATLVNGYQPAGTYSVDFTPTNLASGVYFYRLTAGVYTSTRKMVIIK